MKKSLLTFALASLFCAGVVSQAQAATETFTATKAMSTTNWADSLFLSKFDTHLGTLTGIKFDLSGTVQGTGKGESLDATASDVTMSLESMLTLRRPDSSTLLVSNPLFTQHFVFSAFDGSIDFGGTSGGSTGLRSATGSNSFTSTNTSDFALFSGPGSIALGLNALGSSYASGAGNLITQFSTAAAGEVRVTYEYTVAAAVPEPETYGMLLLGLGLVGCMAGRKSLKRKV